MLEHLLNVYSYYSDSFSPKQNIWGLYMLKEIKNSYPEKWNFWEVSGSALILAVFCFYIIDYITDYKEPLFQVFKYLWVLVLVGYLIDTVTRFYKAGRYPLDSVIIDLSGDIMSFVFMVMFAVVVFMDIVPHYHLPWIMIVVVLGSLFISGVGPGALEDNDHPIFVTISAALVGLFFGSLSWGQLLLLKMDSRLYPKVDFLPLPLLEITTAITVIVTAFCVLILICALFFYTLKYIYRSI